jgi:hypothetical protein
MDDKSPELILDSKYKRGYKKEDITFELMNAHSENQLYNTS